MRHPIIIDSSGNIEKSDGSIISKMLRSQSGKIGLAMSMINPIRKNLSYVGIARKAFSIQQLPPGALPIYNNSEEKESE